MTDDPVDLDEHRGMAAQKSTEIRRRLHEVQADQAALRHRQEELETFLLAAPATTWPEAAALRFGNGDRGPCDVWQFGIVARQSSGQSHPIACSNEAESASIGPSARRGWSPVWRSGAVLTD